MRETRLTVLTYSHTHIHFLSLFCFYLLRHQAGQHHGHVKRGGQDRRLGHRKTAEKHNGSQDTDRNTSLHATRDLAQQVRVCWLF